jgi:hypothetical protein
MSLVISSAILEQARSFFEERGSLGCEGTAMIAGMDGVATQLVIPDQNAHPIPRCWVEVTREGKSELAAALGPKEMYVSRIHSHPGLAFHSPTDDVNPAITYSGALSIVVPFFGLGLRHGLDLCAVLVRRDGKWIEVPCGPERNTLVVQR